jgi:hypothetical protein
MEAANEFALGTSWWTWLCSVPWLAGEGGSVGCNESEEFNNLVWCLQIIGLGVDTGFFLGTGAILRGYSPLSTLLWGSTNFGLAIGAAVKDGGTLESAEGIISTVPGALKFLSEPAIVELTESGSILALLAIDILCNGTATVMSIIRAVEL